MSYADQYEPLDPELIQKHVDAIHASGRRAIFYTSAWFHRTRDARVYAEAVSEQADRFGFDGVYSDGLPAIDWIVGYEEMRLLRERFPNGPVIIHDSLPQSGRHPAEFTPWIYTYATATYMAEHLASDLGEKWNWPRYVLSQWRVANTVGSIKGDRWTGPGFGQRVDRYLAGLVYNARMGGSGVEGLHAEYNPRLWELEALWEEHRGEPFFYDRWFVEAARQVSGNRFRVGPAAMPIVGRDDTGAVTLRSQTAGATIHYTLDGSEPSAESPVYERPIPDAAGLRAVAIADGLEPSPPTPATGPAPASPPAGGGPPGPR